MSNKVIKILILMLIGIWISFYFITKPYRNNTCVDNTRVDNTRVDNTHITVPMTELVKNDNSKLPTVADESVADKSVDIDNVKKIVKEKELLCL